LVAVFVELLFFAAIQQMARQDAVASPPDPPQLRTWTNRQGVAIQGKFVGLDGDNVVLKKDDGKMYPVPFVSLSDADQQYVRQRADVKGQPEEKPAAAPRKTAPTQRSSVATFTNKKTGETFKGKILKFEEDAGYGKYLVESGDGRQGWLYLHQWAVKRMEEGNLENPPKITAAPTAPDGSEQLPPEEGQSGRAVVKMNPSGGTKPPATALPQAAEVIVTGIGTDPEKALQNAFSQAIEQTVGVLVDAESVVKNDQLIRDELLTYSRGYVEKYDVVKRWQEDALHHATIRAVVARDKLVEKLRGMKIAVHEVAGDLASRQFEFDAKNEEQAAEMLGKALAAFDMTKLTKVEIMGEPEITREGANATVHVDVQLSPDLTQWAQVSQGLRYVLAAAATRRGGITRGHTGAGLPKGCPLEKQLEGDGMLVSLFEGKTVITTHHGTSGKKGHSKTPAAHTDAAHHSGGEVVQWEVFRVPNVLERAIKAAASRTRYRLVCALLDQNDNDLARITALRSTGSVYRSLGEAIYRHSEYPLGDIWWIGPVWWRESPGNCVPVFEVTGTLEISQADLAKVVNTVAFLERDAEHGDSKHGDRSAGNRKSAASAIRSHDQPSRKSGE
jgi:hypothetical protein